jgi:hypothetical protein
MSEGNPEDGNSVGRDNLELAQALAGQTPMGGQAFLEKMARSDEDIGDEAETDGMSHHIRIGAQIAREMLEAGEYEDVMHKWAEEDQRRWRESKFFKLWQEEVNAGRDPEKAFEERGWAP